MMTAYTINLDPIVKLTKEQFYELCSANPELKLERNTNGELVIMSPTGGETGAWNSDITIDLGIWNRPTAKGKTFDSSTGFSLPRGSDRSSDAAWIPIEKLTNQTQKEEGWRFAPPLFLLGLIQWLQLQPTKQ